MEIHSHGLAKLARRPNMKIVDWFDGDADRRWRKDVLLWMAAATRSVSSVASSSSRTGATRMTTNSNPRGGVEGARPTTADAADEILLVYDRQCPACDAYCRRVRVRASAGTLRLIDARELLAIMDEITAAGLDVDQGMVVKTDGRLYYGSEAINVLAQRSDQSGIFNRLNYHVFGSGRVARAIYPGLRACRNVLLRLLGRTRINNLRLPGNDRF